MSTDEEQTKAILDDASRLPYYIDLYKQSVDTQQHFNDIEWRIRGLALTAATFALGAGGFAAKGQAAVDGISPGTIVVGVGLILWYAFYFVDRYWYHPLLKASVDSGTNIEKEIQKLLPEAGMTQKITAQSRYEPKGLPRLLSGKSEMRSDDKLVWFYKVGAVALAIVAVGLQIDASLSHPGPTVIQIERAPGSPAASNTPHPAPQHRAPVAHRR